VALLVVLSSLPIGAAVADTAERERLAVLAGAGVAHLVLALLARRPFLQSLLLPPVAWAFLLAERLAPRGSAVRAWARATCLVGTVLLLGAAVGTGARPEAVDPVVAVGLGVLGGVVLVLTVEAARGLFLRWLLAPVWVAGTALLVLGGVALLPLAALVGRGRALLAVATGAVAGAAAFVRRV
jgi:hypothetical protein